MAWTQTRDANWKIPYTGGWCLAYVQNAFGTDHPYSSAIDAWNANYGNGNHPGELPPAGKTVPVYFSLGSVPAGHVAISLDDGTVASSTQGGQHSQGYLHPNLQNLIDMYGKANGGCTYLGWSEYVGTVRVVTPITQGGDNVAIIQDADNWRFRANKSFQDIRGRSMAPNELAPWVGKDFLHLIEALEDDPEADANANAAVVGKQALQSDWQGQIATLTKQLADANSQLAQAQSLADDDGSKIKDLTAQLSAAQATIKQLQDAASKPPATTTTPTTPPSTPTSSTSTPFNSTTFSLFGWLAGLLKGWKK